MHSLAEKDGGSQEDSGPRTNKPRSAHRVEKVITRVLAKQRSEVKRSSASHSDPESDGKDWRLH